MHFNCRNLNGTVLLQSLTTSCSLYTWEKTNSSNKARRTLELSAELSVSRDCWRISCFLKCAVSSALSQLISISLFLEGEGG